MALADYIYNKLVIETEQLVLRLLREADHSKYKDSMRPLIEKDIADTAYNMLEEYPEAFTA